MSKTDDMRAMREARYAAPRAPAAKPATAARPPAAAGAPTSARRVEKPQAAPAAGSGAAPVPDGLCGHRAISGRTCTREQGHAAKSHRYA